MCTASELWIHEVAEERLGHAPGSFERDDLAASVLVLRPEERDGRSGVDDVFEPLTEWKWKRDRQVVGSDQFAVPDLVPDWF